MTEAKAASGPRPFPSPPLPQHLVLRYRKLDQADQLVKAAAGREEWEGLVGALNRRESFQNRVSTGGDSFFTSPGSRSKGVPTSTAKIDPTCLRPSRQILRSFPRSRANAPNSRWLLTKACFSVNRLGRSTQSEINSESPKPAPATTSAFGLARTLPKRVPCGEVGCHRITQNEGPQDRSNCRPEFWRLQ